jgi:2OG-Fe(II) oxygenase superfamily
MKDLLNLDRFPLDRPDSPQCRQLAERCKADFTAQGMFTLEGFVNAPAVDQAVLQIDPLIGSEGYRHARRHNIYFKDDIAGLAPDHPALRKVETVNYTLCADQLAGTVVQRIYEWIPLADFLARVLNKPRLFLMADPLARLNVLAYGPGEALNWHFDRSQFTTTLLIRAAESGGEFEYRSALRSDAEPNYSGVARLLRGEDPQVSVLPLAAGSLNVFAGRNTAHRVTPVGGSSSRIVAVFSYYEEPGFMFSSAERQGFYGRN